MTVTSLTVQEIQELINSDNMSEMKRQAVVGVRYYEARHDIKDYRVFYFNDDGELVEDRSKSNQRRYSVLCV